MYKRQGKEESLRLAAAVESLSEHPLARAVAESYEGEPAKAEDFRSLTGRGVSCLLYTSRCV